MDTHLRSFIDQLQHARRTVSVRRSVACGALMPIAFTTPPGWIAHNRHDKSDADIERPDIPSQQVLKRINAALQRIEDGAYGYCVECGHAIDIARLEDDPADPYCEACKALNI